VTSLIPSPNLSKMDRHDYGSYNRLEQTRKKNALWGLPERLLFTIKNQLNLADHQEINSRDNNKLLQLTIS
jgi:hypothetical protein